MLLPQRVIGGVVEFDPVGDMLFPSDAGYFVEAIRIFPHSLRQHHVLIEHGVKFDLDGALHGGCLNVLAR